MTLDEVLRAVREHVPYANATARTEGDGWVFCETLVDDTTALTAVVQGAKAGFETHDDVVAASLFAEAYAFRSGCGALVAYALDLPVPDTNPRHVAVRIDKPRPTAVAYLDADLRSARASDLAEVFVARHMRAFVARMRERFVIGERLLWGNIAAGCAVVFRAVESSSADRPRVRERAAEFEAACRPWFGAAGSYRVVVEGDREGWYWDRASCCLWYRTANGGLCDNCSLIDRDELDRRRRVELATGAD